LDVDALTALRRNPNSPLKNMDDSTLLRDLNLKEFDKTEKLTKDNMDTDFSRENKGYKANFLQRDQDESTLRPIQKFRAISWAIVHFLWLLKLAQDYRLKKKDNEGKLIGPTLEIISQAIRMWLFDILKIPVTSVDKMNTKFLDVKPHKYQPSKEIEMSFRKLSVRVEGIVNILFEQTGYLPDLMTKFFRKIFREGGYINQEYWTPFEMQRIELDELETLKNFTKERSMFLMSYLVLAKILIQSFLLSPQNIRGFKVSKKEKEILKVIGSILYYIYRDAVIDNFTTPDESFKPGSRESSDGNFSRASSRSILSGAKSSRDILSGYGSRNISNNPESKISSRLMNPTMLGQGDDELLSKLTPRNRLGYIFELESSWVKRVKMKLIRWVRALHYFIQMRNKNRKLSSRISSRSSKRL